MSAGLRTWLDRRLPPLPAAMVRIAIGAAALLKAQVLTARAGAILAPDAVRAPWAGGLPAPSLASVYVALGVWTAASLAFTLGWHTRVAGTILVLSIAFVIAADRHFFSNHLHLLLISAFLLTVARSSAAASLGRRSGRCDGRDIPAWPLDLLRLQVSIVYFFGAAAKINPDFLSGSTIAATWSSTHTGQVLVAGLGRPGLVAASLATVMVELWLARALWVVRTRHLAIAVGVLLHAGFLVLIAQPWDLAVFGVVVLALYLLFLDAGERSRLLIWDDRCTFCAGWVRAVRALDWMRVHRYAGSSQPGVLEAAGVSQEEARAGLQHLGPRGRAQGYDAVAAALELLPATFLIAPFLRLPGIRDIGRRAYGAAAARRHCRVGGAVPLDRRSPHDDDARPEHAPTL